MPAKTDDPTGVNWNGAATNERERVGVGQTFDKIISYQIADTVSIESVPAAVCASLHAQYAP